MEAKQYDYGMIGLGTMGRNLVFNMNDHEYAVRGQYGSGWIEGKKVKGYR